MTTLYINEEHCTSLEQLRNYFEESPSYHSSLFYDLIDYARSGDMSAWLREKGESNLADKLDSIAGSLGDGDYFSRLSALMTGNENMFVKPDFSKCFQVEDLYQEENSEEMKVQVLLKVLSPVNETYELAVRTSWGLKGDTVNPFYEKKDGILTMSLKFRKRPGIEFKIIGLMADGKELEYKKCTESGKDVLEFEVGTCRFKMIRVEHGTFMMGATEEQGNDASSHEKPCHKEKVKDFFMMESVVTQELWEIIMGSNPSSFKGSQRPVTNVSFHDCCTFIKKLNYLTKETFRLPTESEWEYAARGGKYKCNTVYSGSDQIEEVAWYYRNSNHATHNIKQKKPNKLGLYDMSGNVWEWCATKNHSFNGEYTEHSYWYINRGGCVTSQKKGCRTTRRYYSHPKHKSCFLGFRLAK